jgi:ABC-type sugar transport system substrate-binding protein
MTDKEFYQALLDYKGKKEPLHETTAVLAYEVGRMLEQSMYLYWQGEDKCRVGFFKSELIDAIAQIILICGALGVDYNEMRVLGIEKAVERFTHKEKK